MFPMNLWDAVVSDQARRMRQINCFAWMREGISRARGGRFGRRRRDSRN